MANSDGQPIYLDHSATTPMLPEVWEAMAPFAAERFGNPASAHRFGRAARQALEAARESIAANLAADPDEVVFTSGATEANNLALFGLAEIAPQQGVVISDLEHPSVFEPAEELRRRGYTLVRLPVGADGRVRVETNQKLPAGAIVCVQFANHETGVLQPVGDLQSRLAATSLIHCDAAAAVGKTAVRFQDLGVATMTVSAHKFHGPKGIGALLVRREVKLRPTLFGGPQQRGLRPGTEPVGLAVGFAKALELATSQLESRTAYIKKLRDQFVERIEAGAAPIVVNGAAQHQLPHVVNISFPGCPADVLLMKLDLAGVACSTGSACSSGSLLPSPVIRAMGVADDLLRSAMRFSFAHVLTEAEVRRAATIVCEVVKSVRAAR